MEKSGPPTFWVGLGMTVNLGNFESQKIDFGVANIPLDATPEYLQNLMNEAKPRIETVVQGLGEQMIARYKDIKGA